MKLTAVVASLLLCCLAVGAQKSNDAIKQQIKSLKADKSITLTYDGSSSKLMASATNFSDSDAKAANILAANFGMAFFYPGQTLTTSPETINLTFWVMSKKPRFASSGLWEATLPSGPLSLGEYRYAAKPENNMEYLNYKISRSDLAKIAASPLPVKFRLGAVTWSFTPEQMQLLRNFIALSDTK
ncbi:MAG TPA: hypothetical protein VL501_02980 [Pyrinomonadaceae bacterium]|nr:hypothetical protein [Pyrinomonadaceae bacterium]